LKLKLAGKEAGGCWNRDK